MDESFFLRAKRLLEQQRPLKHGELIRALEAQRAALPTTAARSCVETPATGNSHAICALLNAEQDWRRFVQIQGGCFNRAVAARGVKGT